MAVVPAPVESRRRNLALRVASAFLLLPLIVWLIVLGGWPFACLIGVSAGLCTQEIYAMSLGGPGPKPAPVPGIGWMGVAVAVGLPFLATGGLFAWAPFVLLAFLVAAFASQVFSVGSGDPASRDLGVAAGDVPRLVFGLVYGALLITTLVLLRRLPHGAWWCVMACTVTWMNDTGAYFVGHAIGRHKLAPRVSPGKTWEGFAGGLVSSVVFGYVVKLLGLHELSLLDCLAIGIPAGLLGPLGDLSESLLKRGCGVKDSGVILPGHGGKLDRIDALIFNAPFVYLYASLMKGLPWH